MKSITKLLNERVYLTSITKSVCLSIITWNDFKMTQFSNTFTNIKFFCFTRVLGSPGLLKDGIFLELNCLKIKKINFRIRIFGWFFVKQTRVLEKLHLSKHVEKNY